MQQANDPIVNSKITAGPVIIENGRVLLNKEKKGDVITDWYFPGGRVETGDTNLELACKRETKEELGIDIEIIKPLSPILINENGVPNVLIHFLARRIGEVVPGDITHEWGWHDINNLPGDCAENVYRIIEEYKKSL